MDRYRVQYNEFNCNYFIATCILLIIIYILK